MCRRCACVGACARRKSVGRARVRPVYEMCVSARGCTLENQGNFDFTRVLTEIADSSATIRFLSLVCVLRHGETRTSVLSSSCGVLVCDLSSVQL